MSGSLCHSQKATCFERQEFVENKAELKRKWRKVEPKLDEFTSPPQDEKLQIIDWNNNKQM